MWGGGGGGLVEIPGGVKKRESPDFRSPEVGISEIVGKIVHATIPKGNMGYNQYTVPGTVAFEPTFVAFL